MTTEELRQTIVKGIDDILEAPFLISRLLKDDHRRILRGQRAYWQNDDGPQLQKLLSLVEREPVREEGVPSEG